MRTSIVLVLLLSLGLLFASFGAAAAAADVEAAADETNAIAPAILESPAAIDRRDLAAKKQNNKKKATAAPKPQKLQFRMVAAPTMCAAGKSSWVDATGAGPLHLELCKNNRGKVNPNTVFLSSVAKSNPSLRSLARQNSNKKNFCLHNFGGGFAVLSLINPCVPGPDESWSMQKALNRVVLNTNAELGPQCWDTLGNFFVYTRIGLAACDLTSTSQRFRHVVVR